MWTLEGSEKAYQWNETHDSGSNIGTSNNPSNVYGTSYMRSVVLNNGKDYYKVTDTLNNGTITGKNDTPTTDTTIEFVNFTTNQLLVSNCLRLVR